MARSKLAVEVDALEAWNGKGALMEIYGIFEILDTDLEPGSDMEQHVREILRENNDLQGIKHHFRALVDGGWWWNGENW